MSSQKSSFDKYSYYAKAVQSPEADIDFFNKVFLEIHHTTPLSLKEDFCGTFLLCHEWIKQSPQHTALGLELDSQPLNYGEKNYLQKLSSDEQAQIKLYKEDVLSKKIYGLFDLVIAQNFSYFLFKQRKQLLQYFENAKNHLNKKGLLILDVFGGIQCGSPNIEEVEHKDFIYSWDQDSFNPITNEAQFYIHFKEKKGETHKKAFSYDWRMWSVPELKEILMDAGFKKVFVYWEQDSEACPDGEYVQATRAENEESWVAYLVGMPS